LHLKSRQYNAVKYLPCNTDRSRDLEVLWGFLILKDMLKKCSKCKEEKSYDEFYKDKRRKDGFYHRCKICTSEANKNSRNKNKDKAKEDNKKWREDNEINKKKCSKCKVIKKIEYFHKNNYKKDGYSSQCVICQKESSRKYYEKHKSKVNNKSKKWRDKNKENVSEYNKKWFAKNPKYNISRSEYKNEWNKKRRETDEVFKFKEITRRNINSSFNRGKNKFKKNSKTETILGCTIEEFIYYIESKFTEGMTFENHGLYGWHLDHIIPLTTAKTEDDVIRLNHYTNFQPLWAKDNLKKGGKL